MVILAGKFTLAGVREVGTAVRADEEVELCMNQEVPHSDAASADILTTWL